MPTRQPRRPRFDDLGAARAAIRRLAPRLRGVEPATTFSPVKSGVKRSSPVRPR